MNTYKDRMSGSEAIANERHRTKMSKMSFVDPVGLYQLLGCGSGRGR